MWNRYVLPALAACSCSSTTEHDAPEIANTDRGEVRGAREGDVLAWRGIPYAAPPIGDLRWRVPRPVDAWNGVRDATAWGPGCVQISTAGQLVGGSEDCLFLNVWAPAARAQPLPVLVFIHGGYNLHGSSGAIFAGERVYDGAYVAAHGPAIVVTFDYRLGALGFFTSPALAAESETGASGNYAHHDQLAALRWVHDNIAAFGGDPKRVLVFGESAGGAATCTLVSSPRATGLFSRALIQSAGCGAKTSEVADRLSTTLVSGAGCTDAPDVLACLRAQSADAIAVAAPIDLATDRGARWGTSIDGDLVRESPSTAIPAGRHNHMPIAIGTTADEFSTLINAFVRVPVTTDAEYRQVVADLFPIATDAILARYPSGASPMRALVALMSDAVMHCPTRRIARVLARAQREPVRRFLFAHTYSNGPLARLGAGHALELPFVFHNLALAGFTPSADELALADAMVGYWVRFADTGDPNGANAAAWPIYDPALDPTIIFDTPVGVTHGVRAELCDFWDRGATMQSAAAW